jgi:hypothetical protein
MKFWGLLNTSKCVVTRLRTEPTQARECMVSNSDVYLVASSTQTGWDRIQLCTYMFLMRLLITAMGVGGFRTLTATERYLINGFRVTTAEQANIQYLTSRDRRKQTKHFYLKHSFASDC